MFLHGFSFRRAMPLFDQRSLSWENFSKATLGSAVFDQEIIQYNKLRLKTVAPPTFKPFFANQTLDRRGVMFLHCIDFFLWFTRFSFRQATPLFDQRILSWENFSKATLGSAVFDQEIIQYNKLRLKTVAPPTFKPFFANQTLDRCGVMFLHCTDFFLWFTRFSFRQATPLFDQRILSWENF